MHPSNIGFLLLSRMIPAVVLESRVTIAIGTCDVAMLKQAKRAHCLSFYHNY